MDFEKFTSKVTEVASDVKDFTLSTADRAKVFFLGDVFTVGGFAVKGWMLIALALILAFVLFLLLRKKK